MLSTHRIPPPPKKKTNSQSLEKTELYISEKNLLSNNYRSLPNTSLHYLNNLNHPKESSTSPKRKKIQPPPPPPNIYTPLEQSQPLEKILTSVKNTTSPQKSSPPPH